MLHFFATIGKQATVARDLECLFACQVDRENRRDAQGRGLSRDLLLGPRRHIEVHEISHEVFRAGMQGSLRAEST